MDSDQLILGFEFGLSRPLGRMVRLCAVVLGLSIGALGQGPTFSSRSISKAASLANIPSVYADYILNATTCTAGTVIPDQSGNGHNAIVVGSGLTCDGLGFSGFSTSSYLSLSSGTAVTYSAVKTVEAFVDVTNTIILNSVQQGIIVGSLTAADVTFCTSSHYPITGETAAASANTMPTVFLANNVASQFGEQVPGGPHFVAWQLGAGSFYANDQTYIDGLPNSYGRLSTASVASSRVGTATIGQTANGPTGFSGKIFRVTLRNAQVSDAAISQDYNVMRTALQNNGVQFNPDLTSSNTFTGTTLTIVGDSTSYFQTGETSSWPASLSLTDPNGTRIIISAYPGERAVDVMNAANRTISAFKAPLGRNVLVYKMGVNDIAANNTVAQADQRWYIYALPWIQERIAEGYTVLVPTLTACGSTATGTCETARAEWNLLIAKSAASVGYTMVDDYADVRLQTYTDANYFLQGVSTQSLHLTDAGNALLAAYMSSAINGLYAVTEYPTQTITGAANGSFTDADTWIVCNTTGTITLPYPTGKTGQKRIIQNIRAGTCAVNVAAAPTSTTNPITTTVASGATYSIAPSSTKTFVADNNGSNWSVADSGNLFGTTFNTSTNCSSAASPAVCGSAAAGSVAVPVGTNQTLQVNTSAVTANSQIFLQSDSSLGTKLGITCNATPATEALPIAVTTRSAGVSFTLLLTGISAATQPCYSYFIVN